MGKAQRVTAEDTVDSAIHMLHKMQAEGWGMESLNAEVEYAKVGDSKPVKIPVATVVTVRLVPRC